VMSLTNIYIGLKTGWALGVAITACILSFTIWRGLRTVGLVKSDFSILENNCMQSTATSAGYSVGGTMVSAIAAMMMITGKSMGFWTLVSYNVALAVLGVVMAVPMKRQMINIEQLKFPSGVACAETLRSLHASGDEAMRKARALGIAGALGAVVAWVRDATFTFMPWNMPSSVPFGSLAVQGIPLTRLTMSWDMGLIMIAAGAIMGFKVAWSMLLGAIVNYVLMVPPAIHRGDIVALNAGAGIGFRDITRWSLWTGVSMMVVSSIVMLFLNGGAILRAFSGVGAMFGRKSAERDEDMLAAIEVPNSWMAIGLALSSVIVIYMLGHIWHVRWWMSLVAIAMTFVLSLVACRATGETDTTPTGAMGKVVQLTYGILAPANMTTNLMTASVTANSAGCAADLLTDLKSGYLLGANSRKQFIAQMAGILPGAIVVGLAWRYLVPNAEALGTDRFPAPAAQVWKAVAELLSKGVDSVPVTARIGAFCGAFFGLALPLAERAFPKARRFIPSPTGFGLAFVMQGFNSISMFVGALVVVVLERARPRLADTYVIPVASGLIAGESLMAILVTVMFAVGVASK
jgi:OPT family oligopeptide transporter